MYRFFQQTVTPCHRHLYQEPPGNWPGNKMDSQNDSVSLQFTEFPEDIQLIILSFLTPSEITAFSCTSKRFNSLFNTDSKLWFFLCDRKFGSKTQINKWAAGKISFKRLYKILSELENLIGFWRRSGPSKNDFDGDNKDNVAPVLLCFEWGPCCVIGSRVSGSKNGGYEVVKEPCLWVCLDSEGERLSYLDLNCKVGGFDDLGCFENELIRVSVNFMGNCHFVVEENVCFDKGGDTMSLGDKMMESVGNQLMSDMYQYFANRTSPGGERWARRQKRKEKERKSGKKWEPEHYVKIVNCSPTPSRPLQGLWKGFCDAMKLDFYLVAYDDIGGIACRMVEDSSKPFSGYAPVFWTSNTKFIESPVSLEEQYIYDSRTHFRPPEASDDIHGDEAVVRIMYINSSYGLVTPNLAGTSVNSRQGEGRIWQYGDGTFGFGFLRDNHIVDLKHITRNDNLIDTT
ncbi:F-box protein At3g12350-like [Apium graveolens]|uniref:F-box protein At3g12350-like n=1 Tax=Apium graveolens TaxID=4045 RepID=UPI003D7A79F9